VFLYSKDQMESVGQSVAREVGDNWPAFIYIALTIGFSICFLRERRAEIRLLKLLATGLHERIDRLERTLARSRNISALPESRQKLTSESVTQL
jgi:hypothetical protein